jgi:tyrosinase
MAHQKFVSRPIKVPSEKIGRADIQFRGVEQAGPSFEARVFLNNPEADASTPMNAESGYAGSFHIYGYGLPTDAAGDRRAEAKVPMERQLTATEPVKAALASKGDAITVTVVPVLPDHVAPAAADPLKISDVEIKTYPD